MGAGGASPACLEIGLNDSESSGLVIGSELGEGQKRRTSVDFVMIRGGLLPEWLDSSRARWSGCGVEGAKTRLSVLARSSGRAGVGFEGWYGCSIRPKWAVVEV